MRKCFKLVFYTMASRGRISFSLEVWENCNCPPCSITFANTLLMNLWAFGKDLNHRLTDKFLLWETAIYIYI